MSSETDFQSLRDLIFYMLLGDGHITKYDPVRNSCMELCHSIKQKEYLFWKVSLLNDFGIKTGAPYYRKDKFECRIRTERSPIFGILRKRCYDESGKKYLSKRMLKDLTPLGLSIWFMDDGSAKLIHPIWRKNKYNVSDRPDYKLNQIKFAVCSFDEKSNTNAIDILKKNFGLNFTLIYEKNKKQNKEYPMLLLQGYEQLDLFKNIVSPHIIPSMRYKIDHPTSFSRLSPEETERNENEYV